MLAGSHCLECGAVQDLLDTSIASYHLKQSGLGLQKQEVCKWDPEHTFVAEIENLQKHSDKNTLGVLKPCTPLTVHTYSWGFTSTATPYSWLGMVGGWGEWGGGWVPMSYHLLATLSPPA